MSEQVWSRGFSISFLDATVEYLLNLKFGTQTENANSCDEWMFKEFRHRVLTVGLRVQFPPGKAKTCRIRLPGVAPFFERSSSSRISTRFGI